MNFCRSLAILCLCLLPETSASSTSKNNDSPLVSFPLIPHHVQQTRRGLKHQEQERSASLNGDGGSLRRRRAAEGEQVSALYQGYGTHYVDIWCGSPPQRQTVIVDSGSGVTAFPCSECKKCGVPDNHIDELFNEGSSSTYEKSKCETNEQCTTRGTSCQDGSCRLTMSYSEGSRWDATMGTDRCYLGGPHEQPLLQEFSTDDPLDPEHATHYAFDVKFGCQTYLNGLFITQMADGIMGMNVGKSSYWSQMSEQLGTKQQFSLCFSHQPSADDKGTEAGALTLGGTDTRLHSTEMVYSSGTTKGRERRWNVKVRKMFLRHGDAGESVTPTTSDATILKLDVAEDIINTESIIVDSGATDTYLNKQLAGHFESAFEKLSGRKYSNKAWSLTPEELKRMPTIIYQLYSSENENPGKDPYSTPGLAGNFDKEHPYDVLVAVPPSHYMEFKASTGTYTPRIYLSARGHSTLGANVIMGHDVHFDYDNDRLGWAESSCDYTGLAKENGYDFSITGELKEAADLDDSNDDGNYFEPDDPKDTHRRGKEFTANRNGNPNKNKRNTPMAKKQKPLVDVNDPDLIDDDDGEGDDDEVPTGEAEDKIPIDCHEELIDRSQNLTSHDRLQNETFVAMCKVKKGASEFLDYCDSPECRIPVIVGLVVALLAGMCCCRVVRCICFYLFCCCCCKKKDSNQYQGVDTDEIELTDGVGYRDTPESDEEEDRSRSRNRSKFLGKKKYSDKGSKKKETFKGDFKDFI